MKLKSEWDTLRRRIEEAFHPANAHGCADAAGYGQDDREWVVMYRTVEGFCCMYRGLPVNFKDMLDVQIWTEDIDARPYFMGR